MSNIKSRPFTDKEYAEYMFASYYLGHTNIALLMGATLFEKYIMQQINKGTDNITLENAINIYLKKESILDTDMLCNSKFPKNISERNELKNTLHNYRILRNSIVHEEIHQPQNTHGRYIINNGTSIDLERFMLYVYASITRNILERIEYSKSANNTLIYDYKLKEIQERMISNIDSKLDPESNEYKNFSLLTSQDFENLFTLRRKLILLKTYIEKSVKNIGLTPTILSPIDTTSAYIWMPFVDEKFIDNTKDIIETKRNNLVMGSTSILATPMDLRIYIDFGGGDFDFRISYQKFLQSDVFKRYIERFKDLQPTLQIFTTRWYSFITKQHNALEFIEKEAFSKNTEKALTYLQNANTQKNIITSGRNLLGFILPSDEDLSKEFILEKFKEIAHLYYEFLVFKFPDSEKELREKQNKLFSHNSDLIDEDEDTFSFDVVNQFDNTIEDNDCDEDEYDPFKI